VAVGTVELDAESVPYLARRDAGDAAAATMRAAISCIAD
jgi:hypothetical protein